MHALPGLPCMLFQGYHYYRYSLHMHACCSTAATTTGTAPAKCMHACPSKATTTTGTAPSICVHALPGLPLLPVLHMRACSSRAATTTGTVPSILIPFQGFHYYRNLGGDVCSCCGIKFGHDIRIRILGHQSLLWRALLPQDEGQDVVAPLLCRAQTWPSWSAAGHLWPVWPPQRWPWMVGRHG